MPVVNASAGPAGRYGHSMVAYNVGRLTLFVYIVKCNIIAYTIT